ncbi:MAG TPA: hypothetical protein PK036_11200 [Geobacteraceae bacterium]|nr:hypothetical protein [Geobacteraceae bacterium]
MNQEITLQAMAGQSADFRESLDCERFRGLGDCVACVIAGASELNNHFSIRSGGETMALLNALQQREDIEDQLSISSFFYPAFPVASRLSRCRRWNGSRELSIAV